MSRVQALLDKYGESHTHGTNKLIHWICVPLILFSIIGLIRCIPFFGQSGWLLNWAGVALIIALIYYIRLSIPLALGFLMIAIVMLLGQEAIFRSLDSSVQSLLIVNLAIFILAWIGQFIGHKIEGKKPSFLEDIQFLLIGPAWLMHFIYDKLGIPY